MFFFIHRTREQDATGVNFREFWVKPVTNKNCEYHFIYPIRSQKKRTRVIIHRVCVCIISDLNVPCVNFSFSNHEERKAGNLLYTRQFWTINMEFISRRGMCASDFFPLLYSCFLSLPANSDSCYFRSHTRFKNKKNEKTKNTFTTQRVRVFPVCAMWVYNCICIFNYTIFVELMFFFLRFLFCYTTRSNVVTRTIPWKNVWNKRVKKSSTRRKRCVLGSLV